MKDPAKATASRWLRATVGWFDETVVGLTRELRWSYLPPLMVYLAAGVSALTSVIGTFIVHDYLALSAASIAGLAFWTAIPWTLKMPLGHMVDLMWRYKSVLVYLGAVVLAASLGIMYTLITDTASMLAVASAETWYATSVILASTGYVIQDVVADAMTVEAVPSADEEGKPYSDAESKRMHTTMQMLGRFAVVGGGLGVAVLNVTLFSDVEQMSKADKLDTYAEIYLMALVIPLISVAGVILGGLMLKRQARRLRRDGTDEARIRALFFHSDVKTEPNWWVLGGSLVFVVVALTMGLLDVPFSQEIVFVIAISIIIFLIYRLLPELAPNARVVLVGTAIIIFAYRAMPDPGTAMTWFELDVLGFDQQFIAVLSLVTASLALVGMVALRPLMMTHSIAWIIAVLTIATAILALPNIGLFYGIQEWTAALTGGIVDARAIAIIDTAGESPLGQLAMIPMLAWIARNAPAHLKATFFAIMTSFMNLAASGGRLATEYANKVFVVTREVRDSATGVVETAADYSELGELLIVVALIAVIAPLVTIAFVQRSRFRTEQ
jgi:hypothetical protein